MKDFFITKQLTKKDNCKLPDEIPISYVDEYIGNSESEFLINIPEGSSNSIFTELYNVLKSVYKKDRNTRNILPRTTISKDWLFDHYDLIEIPDYGFQSMSPYYTDFVPQVYYGKTEYQKIWQRNVTRIRSFTLKTMWLVLPKSKKYEDPNNKFPIKIAFKPAKPYIKKSDNNNEEYIPIINLNPKIYDQENHILTLESNPIDYSYNFKDLNDYNLYIGNNIYESKLFFFDISFSPVTNVINQQGDYFRQINSSNSNLTRDSNSKIIITLKVRVSKNVIKTYDKNNITLNDGYSYSLHHRGDLKEYYLDDFKTICNKFELREDCNFYDSNGLFKEYNDTLKNIEIIPNYSSIRKYVFKFTGNIAFTIKEIPNILFSKYLYPWNLKNPQFELYNSNDKLVLFNNNSVTPETSISVSNGSHLIVYDTTELDSDLQKPLNDDIEKFDNIELLANEVASVSKTNFGDLYYYHGKFDPDNNNVYYPIRYDENIRTGKNDIKYYKSSSGYYHFSNGDFDTVTIDKKDEELTNSINTIDTYYKDVNGVKSYIAEDNKYHINDDKYAAMEKKLFNMLSNVDVSPKETKIFKENEKFIDSNQKVAEIKNIDPNDRYLLRFDVVFSKAHSEDSTNIKIAFIYPMKVTNSDGSIKIIKNHINMFKIPAFKNVVTLENKSTENHYIGYIWCTDNTIRYIIPNITENSKYSIMLLDYSNDLKFIKCNDYDQLFYKANK